MPVDTKHPSYEAASTVWRLARDVLGGQSSMHAGKETYLPRLAGQSDAEYAAMVKMTEFYAMTARARDALIGQVSRKPAEINPGNLPDEFMDDISQTGQDIENYALCTLDEVMGVGFGGTLVDHPPVTAGLTVAEAEATNLMPIAVYFPAEAVWNWRYKTINGRLQLALLVLYEGEQGEGDDVFEHSTIERLRVLKLAPAQTDSGFGCFYQVFQRENKITFQASTGFGLGSPAGNEWVPVDVEQPIYMGAAGGNQQWNRIPFVRHQPMPGGVSIPKPPMLDQMYINLAHYQVTRDQRHGLYHVGLPTPYATGVNFDQLLSSDKAEKLRALDQDTIDEVRKLYRWGPSNMWLLPEGAQAGLMEFTGGGMSAIAKKLEALEWQSAALSARMLFREDTPDQTATGVTTRHVSEYATLKGVSEATSASMVEIMRLAEMWLGLEPAEDLEFALNTDFAPQKLDANELTALLQGWRSGGYSRATYWHNLRQGGIMRPGVTDEEESDEIESEEPFDVGAEPAPIDPEAT